MTVAVIVKTLRPTERKGTRLKVARADAHKGDKTITRDIYSIVTADGGRYGHSEESAKALLIEYAATCNPEGNPTLFHGTWACGFTPTGWVFVKVNNTTRDGAKVNVL